MQQARQTGVLHVCHNSLFLLLQSYILSFSRILPTVDSSFPINDPRDFCPTPFLLSTRSFYRANSDRAVYAVVMCLCHKSVFLYGGYCRKSCGVSIGTDTDDLEWPWRSLASCNPFKWHFSQAYGFAVGLIDDFNWQRARMVPLRYLKFSLFFVLLFVFASVH